MSAVFMGGFEPGSPEWHAARQGAVGGSEVAAILGLSPFESRFSLWHRKAGHVGPVEQTPEMEWGLRLEEAIARKFFDQHPEYSDEGLRGMWRHGQRGWQIANPDRLLYTPRPDRDRNLDWDVDLTALLETKLSLYGDGWGETGDPDPAAVPIHVRVQVLWYLDVFALERAHVAVLIGGHDYREYVVDYDPVEAVQLRDAVDEFIATIARGERPDIDAHSATYEVIKELHPEIDGTEVELSNEVARLFINAKSAEKQAKDVARHATSLVADQMGQAQRAVWDGRTVARRQARDGGVPYVVAERGLADRELVGATAGYQPEPGEETF